MTGVSGGDGEGREGGPGDGGRGAGVRDGARVLAGGRKSSALRVPGSAGESHPVLGGASLPAGMLLSPPADWITALVMPGGSKGRDSLQTSTDVVSDDGAVEAGTVSWLAETLEVVKRWTGTSLGSRA